MAFARTDGLITMENVGEFISAKAALGSPRTSNNVSRDRSALTTQIGPPTANHTAG